MKNIYFKAHNTFLRISRVIYQRCFVPQWQKQFFLKHNRIRHDYKCIFIHIPKTGGSSITKILNELPPPKLPPPVVNLVNENKLLSSKHMTAQQTKKLLGDEIWGEYFSFAFVRNPWDLMVSSYHWWLQKAYKWKHNHSHIREIEAMGDFTRFISSKFGRQMINEFKGEMFDWISENNQVIVNYVGRFENMQEDWDKICDHIGAPHQQLPHLNKTLRRTYQKYYTPETQQIIYDRFKKIIELYDYEF